MTNHHGETFGAWLLAQRDRTDAVGDLAAAARGDRSFSRSSSADDLRKRLREAMADGDMFDAVDDAELDWRAY